MTVYIVFAHYLTYDTFGDGPGGAEVLFAASSRELAQKFVEAAYAHVKSRSVKNMEFGDSHYNIPGCGWGTTLDYLEITEMEVK